MHITKIETASLRQHLEPLPPTFEAYGELQHAYDFFNTELFGGKLPNCLITLQRRPKAYGYFCGDRFANAEGKRCDEIALNPKHLRFRSFIENVGTLVHEMVHLWQHHFGKPSRSGYHNKEWAREMVRVGLHPSDTGRPGGRMTGQRVSHYIIAGGPFHIVARKLAATPLGLSWFDAQPRQLVGGGPGPEAASSGNRVKFTCPSCEANAWGKASLKLLCLDCRKVMLPGECSRPSGQNGGAEPVAPRLITEEVLP